MKKKIVLASQILGSGPKTLADKLLSLGWYLLMMLKQPVYSPSAKHFFTLGKRRNTPNDGKVSHRNNTCGKISTCLVFEVCGVVKNIFDILETDQLDDATLKCNQAAVEFSVNFYWKI